MVIVTQSCRRLFLFCLLRRVVLIGSVITLLDYDSVFVRRTPGEIGKKTHEPCTCHSPTPVPLILFIY